MPTTMKTNKTWNTPIQKCHLTGMSLRKSTLQNVTYIIKNIQMGKRKSNTGSDMSETGASRGIKANSR